MKLNLFEVLFWVACAVVVWKYHFEPMIRSKFAARRLGLRDKGPTGMMFFSNQCRKCGTRRRVGLTATGHAVLYCWRCEAADYDSPEMNEEDYVMIPSRKDLPKPTDNAIPEPGEERAQVQPDEDRAKPPGNIIAGPWKEGA